MRPESPLRWSACLRSSGSCSSNPPERFDEFKKVSAAEGATKSNFIATHLASGSGSGRWQFWGVALDAFEAQPLHGIGAGAYGDFWNQHAPISRVTGYAHSLYLQQLGELGPLGLLLVLGVILIGPVGSLARGTRGMLVSPQRAAAVAIVATGAASAAIEWTWEVPAAFGPLIVALALLSGPALGPEEARGCRPVVQQPPRLGRGRDRRGVDRGAARRGHSSVRP